MKNMISQGYFMSFLRYFLHYPTHKKLFYLALPIIFSNISIPLLSLVDTAVVGHLGEPAYIGSVAVGALIINSIMWLFGFLRMSITALIAQANGENNEKKQCNILLQGILLATIISIIILLLHQTVFNITLYFMQASNDIITHTKTYYYFRLFALPAMLINIVFLGFFLGNQQSAVVMYLMLFANLLNLILDLIFVYYFNYDVDGVALASSISDYVSLAINLYLLYSKYPYLIRFIKNKQYQLLSHLSSFMQLNINILLRTLCLQVVFWFITIQSVQMGEIIIAANTILLNFTLFFSYALDGIAYFAETEAGRTKGANSLQEFDQSIIISCFWSIIFTIITVILLYYFDNILINTMTNLDDVITVVQKYWYIIILFPFFSVLAYLFDGVYIGLTKGSSLRNLMCLSTILFIIIYYTLSYFIVKETALWLSFIAFVGLRSILMSIHCYITRKNGHIFIAN